MKKFIEVLLWVISKILKTLISLLTWIDSKIPNKNGVNKGGVNVNDVNETDLSNIAIPGVDLQRSYELGKKWAKSELKDSVFKNFEKVLNETFNENCTFSSAFGIGVTQGKRVCLRVTPDSVQMGEFEYSDWEFIQTQKPTEWSTMHNDFISLMANKGTGGDAEILMIQIYRQKGDSAFKIKIDVSAKVSAVGSEESPIRLVVQREVFNYVTTNFLPASSIDGSEYQWRYELDLKPKDSELIWFKGDIIFVFQVKQGSKDSVALSPAYPRRVTF